MGPQEPIVVCATTFLDHNPGTTKDSLFAFFDGRLHPRGTRYKVKYSTDHYRMQAQADRPNSMVRTFRRAALALGSSI